MEASQPMRNRVRVVFRGGAMRCGVDLKLVRFYKLEISRSSEPLELLHISTLSSEFVACPPPKLFSRGGHRVPWSGCRRGQRFR